jgi:diaminohydroxyphosphoribosylaminopyrimidine deaminase / 5-amino-6-(5-phosphoribosylamino)uracil reductase
MVGAVLVGPDGELVGEGWHGRYGGAHAEVWAVLDAERRGTADRLDRSTLYVTLEPCSHFGKTPPCTDLILTHRIPRVVVATTDPNPQVNGQGIEKLRAGGVEVSVGMREHEARRMNEAFLHHVATGRPLVTLKIAQTLDGRVATRTGDSRWVSGEAARRLVHQWRAGHDAILVGAGTARADDPALTVRHVDLPDDRPQPLRIVIDGRGELPVGLRLFSDEHTDRTIAAVGEDAWPEYASPLTAGGGRLVRVRDQNGHLDVGSLLSTLGAGIAPHRAVQSVLVEAGPRLATALLEAGLVDRLFAFVAPKLAGSDALSAVGALGLERMADAPAFAEHAWEVVGDDVLFRGYLREV